MPSYVDEAGPLLVLLLRTLRGWDQRTLAQRAGLGQASISRYESGEPISPEALAQLATAVGLRPSWVVRRLLPVLRSAREQAHAAAAGPPPGKHQPIVQDFAADDAALEAAVREAMHAVLGNLEAAIATTETAALTPRQPSPADREDAARAWERIAACTAEERLWLVEQGAELQTWAFAERLCEESARQAPKGVAAALDLAHLAVAVARLVPGDEPWRLRVQGYARAFVGNARRIAGDLVAAGTEFATAWNLWRAGNSDSLLAEWRLFDLEASLRRDAGQFQAALDLLDRAAALAPPHASGRILLKRASTLQASGDAAAAIAVLHAAGPQIASCDDPRLRFALEFNFCACQCHLGDYAQAETQLPHLRQMALDLDNGADRMRVVWLSGRVAAGRGRQAEACAAFEQARAECLAQGQKVCASIVSLDLALIYLDQGRTAEVRDLAAAMTTILTAERVEPDALVAFHLFCEAAQREAATLDQARRALNLLERRALPALPTAT